MAKLSKDKEGLLKGTREKLPIIYNDASLWVTIDSSETVETRRQWEDISKMLKEKDCQLRTQYLIRLCLKNKEEIKTLSWKHIKNNDLYV